ncbi:MAG: hypothetical protein AB8B49_02845 [Nitratireductor sp.]
MRKIFLSLSLIISVSATSNVYANHGPSLLADCNASSMQQVRSCFSQIKQHAKRHGRACKNICRAAKQQSIATCNLASPPILGCAKEARKELRDCKKICRGN